MSIYLNMLFGQAAREVHPEIVADLILANLDPKQIADFLGDGDPVEKLAALDNRVNLYSDWFRELGQILQGVIADADGIGAESPTSDGATRTDP